jgi:hypothetical protein
VLFTFLEPVNGSLWSPRVRVNGEVAVGDGALADRIRASSGAGWRVCYGAKLQPAPESASLPQPQPLPPPAVCLPLAENPNEPGFLQDVFDVALPPPFGETHNATAWLEAWLDAPQGDADHGARLAASAPVALFADPFYLWTAAVVQGRPDADVVGAAEVACASLPAAVRGAGSPPLAALNHAACVAALAAAAVDAVQASTEGYPSSSEPNVPASAAAACVAAFGPDATFHGSATVNGSAASAAHAELLPKQDPLRAGLVWKACAGVLWAGHSEQRRADVNARKHHAGYGYRTHGDGGPPPPGLAQREAFWFEVRGTSAAQPFPAMQPCSSSRLLAIE